MTINLLSKSWLVLNGTAWVVVCNEIKPCNFLGTI